MIQKVEKAVGNFTHAVSDFMKDTVNTVMDKMTPDRTSDDAPSYERHSSESSHNNYDSNDHDHAGHGSEDESDDDHR